MSLLAKRLILKMKSQQCGWIMVFWKQILIYSEPEPFDGLLLLAVIAEIAAVIAKNILPHWLKRVL
jgi:hypothetical protein